MSDEEKPEIDMELVQKSAEVSSRYVSRDR